MELHVIEREGRETVVLLDNEMRIVKPVFCKPFLAKVAKHFWRMLHRHFGESCNGLVSRFSG